MKNQRAKFLVAGIAASVLMGSFAHDAEAFTYVAGYKAFVANSSMSFRVDVPGVSTSGISWNQAFDEAAQDWSANSVVQIGTVRTASDPCADRHDGIGGVGFSSDLCGYLAGFSPLTQAVALPDFKTRNSIIASDIAYNSNLAWDVYDGNWKVELVTGPDGKPFNSVIGDFRRISKHEIGHALGLDHSQFPRSIVSNAKDRVLKDRVFDDGQITPDDVCGVNIAQGFPAACSMWLPNATTMSGKPTTAIFTGGASKDRGATYGNYFNAADVIDVMATVVVENAHYGMAGRLHVVVQLPDGAMLMMGTQGFVAWDGSVESLRNSTPSRMLSGANELYILKSFAIATSGVSDVSVSVYLGYSLDSEPDELYFSSSPISFVIQ